MDLTTLTDTEARDLLAAVYAEVQRRDAIAQAPAQAEATATETRTVSLAMTGNYQPASVAATFRVS